MQEKKKRRQRCERERQTCEREERQTCEEERHRHVKEKRDRHVKEKRWQKNGPSNSLAMRDESKYFSQNTFQSDELLQSMQHPFLWRFSGHVRERMCADAAWAVQSCETHTVKAHVGETAQVIIGRVIVMEIL